MNNVRYLVVPCYNEEEVLPRTAEILRDKLKKMVSDSIVSKDGNKDSTWSIIFYYCAENQEIMGVKLSHNRGHQNAFYAGMMIAKEDCDCIISTTQTFRTILTIYPDLLKNTIQVVILCMAFVEKEKRILFLSV